MGVVEVCRVVVKIGVFVYNRTGSLSRVTTCIEYASCFVVGYVHVIPLHCSNYKPINIIFFDMVICRQLKIDPFIWPERMCVDLYHRASGYIGFCIECVESFIVSGRERVSN